MEKNLFLNLNLMPKTFPLRLTDEQHKEIRSKAFRAEKSMHAYILDCIERRHKTYFGNPNITPKEQPSGGGGGVGRTGAYIPLEIKDVKFEEQPKECKHDFDEWIDLDDCYQRVCKKCSEVFEKPKEPNNHLHENGFLEHNGKSVSIDIEPLKEEWKTQTKVEVPKEMLAKCDAVSHGTGTGTKPKQPKIEILNDNNYEADRVLGKSNKCPHSTDMVDVCASCIRKRKK
jgi:hypothetical protein